MLMSVSGGSAESGCMIVGLKCHIWSQLVANLAATCSFRESQPPQPHTQRERQRETTVCTHTHVHVCEHIHTRRQACEGVKEHALRRRRGTDVYAMCAPTTPSATSEPLPPSSPPVLPLLRVNVEQGSGGSERERKGPGSRCPPSAHTIGSARP